MGKGAIISSFTKQRVNSRSSTESQLICVDDKISKVLWMKCFLEWQEFPVKLNIIYQDNTISINMEENGKDISGKKQGILTQIILRDLLGQSKGSKY